MIADFPTFSPLQLGDRAAVQQMTRPYAPYSDFNFTSLYSWDTREAIRASVLNGNLVIRFTDYTTGEPFYSFLGDKHVDDTAQQLLSLARSEGIAEELRLIPEVSAWRISPGAFESCQDNDNFDYILSVDRLKSYQGNKLGPKRNFVNRFHKEHEATTAIVDLADVGVQTRFLDMFHRWMLAKGERAENAENELMALHRVMFASRFMPDLFTVATFVEGDLAGFSINEILGNGYAMIHFEKTDASYVGVTAHLMQQMAVLMSERNCQFINYEQDLGVFGLRKGKRSYVPASFLRKYALRPAVAHVGGAPRYEEVPPGFLLTGDAGALGDFGRLRAAAVPRESLRAAAGHDDDDAPPESLSPRSAGRTVLPPACAAPLDLPPLSRSRVEPGQSLSSSGAWPTVRSAAPVPPAPPSRRDGGSPTVRTLRTAPLEADAWLSMYAGGLPPPDGEGPLSQRDPEMRALRRVSRAPLPREEPADDAGPNSERLRASLKVS